MRIPKIPTMLRAIQANGLDMAAHALRGAKKMAPTVGLLLVLVPTLVGCITISTVNSDQVRRSYGHSRYSPSVERQREWAQTGVRNEWVLLEYGRPTDTYLKVTKVENRILVETCEGIMYRGNHTYKVRFSTEAGSVGDPNAMTNSGIQIEREIAPQHRRGFGPMGFAPLPLKSLVSSSRLG